MAISNRYRSFLSNWAVAAVVLGAGATVRGADSAPNAPGAAPMSMSEMVDPRASSGFIQKNLIDGTIFDDWGIKVRGYIEGGYTSNFDRPASGTNGYGILFNDKSDDATLNQLSLIVQRDVTASPSQFDLGFKAQVLYGSDARFTQANGTNFYGSRYANDFDTRAIRPLQTVSLSGTTISIYQKGDIGPGQPLFNPGQGDIENLIDILQAYVTCNVPVSNGMIVTAGKFVTPWGIEHVDPTQNELYSHSFMFTLAEPKTLTGVTAEMPINDDWAAMAGIVVGWDQSLEDNNDFPSFIAQAKYRCNWDPDYIWNFVLSGMVGPEQTDNRSDFRWTVDLTGKTKISDVMNLGFETLLGYEDDRGTTFHRAIKASIVDALISSGEDAIWAGAALYSDLTLDDKGMFVGIARAEAFDDTGGSRGLATTVFDLTLGLNIFPFLNSQVGKDLMIRPEFRYDYADAKIFDDNHRLDQIYFNADIVYKF